MGRGHLSYTRLSSVLEFFSSLGKKKIYIYLRTVVLFSFPNQVHLDTEMNIDTKSLADFLRHIADAIEGYDPAPAAGGSSYKPPSDQKSKEVKLADLQEVAKEIITSGRREELRALLTRLGAKSLSSISSDTYPTTLVALHQILATDDGPQ